METSRLDPSLLFIGVHVEALAPLRFLLEQRARVSGLITLTAEKRSGVSGAVDLTPTAKSAGVPVLRVADVNEAAAIEWAQRLAPDVVLVIGWTHLLGDAFLRIPRVACLGFHASLLPKYRGRAPINWALIHGETETGNTLIVLEPGADVGDIVAQRRIPIRDDDDCATLYEKVSATEIEMLAAVLPEIRDGRLPRRKQDHREATVMPKRRPADGRIDWQRTEKQLFDWVRALTHPYPGAFTHFDGAKLMVWKAERVASGTSRPRVSCGTLELDEAGWPLVATGDGWLRVRSVQLDGQGEVLGREAAQSFLRPGSVLGSTTKESR